MYIRMYIVYTCHMYIGGVACLTCCSAPRLIEDARGEEALSQRPHLGGQPVIITIC